MSTVQRSVFIGGPSHGEIVSGDYSLEETEIVTGPPPVWWNWDDTYRHYYRPRGVEAAGMAVYEYVGQVKPAT